MAAKVTAGTGDEDVLSLRIICHATNLAGLDTAREGDSPPLEPLGGFSASDRADGTESVIFYAGAGKTLGDANSA